MKKLLLFAFAGIVLISCQKSGSEGNPSSSALNTENYAALNIKTSNQIVKISVTSNILNLIYNEDVTLIADSAKITKNWNVHLKEDFTGTQLADYHYQSLTKFGVMATDWVDDNLNNVVLQSSKDTVVNNKLFVKKRIVRTFSYKETFNTAADANKMLNQLLKQTDIIAFSSYFASPELDATNSNTSNTARLIYVKM